MSIKKTSSPLLADEANDTTPAVKMPEATILHRVKTDGYTEQFSSFNLARRVYDKIKRARLEEKEEFKLSIEVFENGQWVELDYVEVNEAYYDWA